MIMTTRSALYLIVSSTLLLTAATSAASSQDAPRVLVFSKTAGFRHSSIETGVAAMRKLGDENRFAVDATEDASVFTDRNLRRYGAVVFLNTTGDVLDARQQDALERYVQAGGGWVGIHSATDTEYEWPWYGRLAGAYFASHPNNPNVRRGTFRVVDPNHPATQGLPSRWERDDEFYNFKSISPDIRVLVDIDETSYEGGTNGARHPMSWFQEYSGGRAFYTNMGHTEATFAEPLFLRHLLGGLRWAMGGGTGALDYRRARPEENRFSKVVLIEKLNEPVELAVLPDERIIAFYGNPLSERMGILGELPPDDPRAIQSRRDLKNINALMGHAAFVARGRSGRGWYRLHLARRCRTSRVTRTRRIGKRNSLTCSTIWRITSQCSSTSNVADSPVVPTATMPSVPLSI